MDLREQLQSTLGSDYALERELGGGGLSRVFVATETALRRSVVVKVLPPELAASVNAERFRREIQLAAGLQHPHIVPLFTAGETNAFLYYSMALVAGESLRERLTRERELPMGDVVRILREVADALAYAHEHGVVHRDIKPENILLSRGHALVSDFGVAKALFAAAPVDRLTWTGLAVGTAAYMAPEQAVGDPLADRRVDLYALGIVAYEMLTGQPPFHGRPAQAMIAAHVTEVPEPVVQRRSGIDPGLASLVMRLLEKRAADRPQSAPEVIRALDALDGRPPRAVTASNRGRRMLFAGLALAAAAAVAVAVELHNRTVASGVPRVAVAPFTNLTGDPSLDHIGRVAADWLADGIVHADSVDFVSAAYVSFALRDANGAPADPVTQLASLGATLVVTGSFVRHGGDSVELNAQVVEARTGKVESPLGSATGLTNNPTAAIDVLRDRLMSALVKSFPMIVVLRSAPPKYSAMREFNLGQERFDRHGDFRGAIEHFRRAIQIDSTFGVAYNMLAVTYLSLRQFDGADSVLQRLERLRVRLPPLGALQLDGLQAGLRGDHETMLRAFQQEAARDGSPIALSVIGGNANMLLRPRIAVPALEGSDSLMLSNGFVGLIPVLATAYHQAGWSHDAELRTILRGRQRFPVPLLLQAQLRAYAGLRRGPDAIALADTILLGITDPAGNVADSVITGALELRAHGDLASAAILVDKVRGWYAEHRMATPPTSRLFSEGQAFFLSGQLDSAEARLAGAARDTLNLDAAGYLALVRLARGDTTRAAAIGDSLASLTRKWMFGAHTFWGGAIAGAIGDRERAVQLLKQSSAEGMSMESWHYAASLDPLHGYPSFNELIRPQREHFMRILLRRVAPLVAAAKRAVK